MSTRKDCPKQAKECVADQAVRALCITNCGEWVWHAKVRRLGKKKVKKKWPDTDVEAVALASAASTPTTTVTLSLLPFLIVHVQHILSIHLVLSSRRQSVDSPARSGFRCEGEAAKRTAETAKSRLFGPLKFPSQQRPLVTTASCVRDHRRCTDTHSPTSNVDLSKNIEKKKYRGKRRPQNSTPPPPLSVISPHRTFTNPDNEDHTHTLVMCKNHCVRHDISIEQLRVGNNDNGIHRIRFVG